MLLFFLTSILCFLQLTLIPETWIGQAGINIVLSYIISISMWRGGKEAIALAFWGGFLLSLFSFLHFGFLPLFYVLIAFFSSLSTGDIFKNSILMMASFGFMWTMLFEILIVISLLFAGYPIDLPQYSLHIILIRSLLNTGIILISLTLLNKIGYILIPDKDRREAIETG